MIEPGGMNLFRLYLTRLVLPFVLVVGMISIPFVWFPEMEPPSGSGQGGIAHMPFPGDEIGPTEGVPQKSEDKSKAARSPFQQVMTLGFALILISVTAGGVMLYGITRRQGVSFRKRFAPKKKGRSKKREDPPPA